MPRGVPFADRPSPEALRAMYEDEGMTLKQISDKVGVSRSSIGHWMEDAGIPRRSSADMLRDRLSMDPPTKDELLGFYMEDRLLLREIAEHYSVSIGTIRRWLTHHEIPTRDEEGTWRKIVDEIEVPYDRDWEGNEITATFDVLECGHRKKRRWIPTTAWIANKGLGVRNKRRRCISCERAGR